MNIEQAQLDIVSRSKEALDRARVYEARLAAHQAELRARIDAHRSLATLGEDPATDLSALKTEADVVVAQLVIATAATADVEAEHARHEADLGAMYGSADVALQKLQQAHSHRRGALDAAQAAQAILDRATGHLEALHGHLENARCTEAERERGAVGRLHAALRDGSEAPSTAEPRNRTSLALEEDVRVGTAMVEKLRADYAATMSGVVLAEAAVAKAAMSVMTAEAERDARELLALRERGESLRSRLNAFVGHAPSSNGKSTSQLYPTPARPIRPGSLEMIRDAPATIVLANNATPLIAQALAPALARPVAPVAYALPGPARPVVPGSPLMMRDPVSIAPAGSAAAEGEYWRRREAALIASDTMPAALVEPAAA